MRNRVRELLEAYDGDLDAVFDVLEIEVEEVINILLQGGHAVLPPWLDDDDVEVEEIEQ